jgi:hypothetical protein
MAIRSAEQFERDSHRGVLHHKSQSLKKVIAALAEYHRAPVGQGKLSPLHRAITEWRSWNPHEFRDRHGNDLQLEVEREMSGAIAEKAAERVKAEHMVKGKLEDGDILFRFVSSKEVKFLQWLISEKQGKQKSLGYEMSSDKIQHVGIYANGFVIEIGAGGLEHNVVVGRGKNDLVVRTAYGEQIAAKAQSAQEDLGQRLYPINDLWKLAKRPGSGGVFSARDRELAWKLNDEEDWAKRNRMKQRVVCSHFVHAVLYAAIENVTLRTATDHKMDHVFKISPSHLWGQFRRKQGIWATARAEWVGVQKNGNLYWADEVDPESFFKGLDRFGV